MSYKNAPSFPSFPAGQHLMGRLLMGAAFVLLVIFAWTSFYTVPTDSQGVLLRFGKYQTTAESGLHFMMPLGIDSVKVLPTRRQLKLEFGFSTPGSTNADQARNDIEEQKS